MNVGGSQSFLTYFCFTSIFSIKLFIFSSKLLLWTCLSFTHSLSLSHSVKGLTIFWNGLPLNNIAFNWKMLYDTKHLFEYLAHILLLQFFCLFNRLSDCLFIYLPLPVWPLLCSYTESLSLFSPNLTPDTRIAGGGILERKILESYNGTQRIHAEDRGNLEAETETEWDRQSDRKRDRERGRDK